MLVPRLTATLRWLKPGLNTDDVSTKTKHDYSSGTYEDNITSIFICFAFCCALGLCLDYDLCTRTHGNVFLHFSFVSSNELLVLDSLENSKQYKNAGKLFLVYGVSSPGHTAHNNDTIPKKSLAY